MVEKRPNFAKSDSSYFSPGAGLCKQEQTKQQQCFHTPTARFLRNDTKSCAEDLSCSAPRDFHYFFIFLVIHGPWMLLCVLGCHLLVFAPLTAYISCFSENALNDFCGTSGFVHTDTGCSLNVRLSSGWTDKFAQDCSRREYKMFKKAFLFLVEKPHTEWKKKKKRQFCDLFCINIM